MENNNLEHLGITPSLVAEDGDTEGYQSSSDDSSYDNEEECSSTEDEDDLEDRGDDEDEEECNKEDEEEQDSENYNENDKEECGQETREICDEEPPPPVTSLEVSDRSQVPAITHDRSRDSTASSSPRKRVNRIPSPKKNC